MAARVVDGAYESLGVAARVVDGAYESLGVASWVDGVDEGRGVGDGLGVIVVEVRAGSVNAGDVPGTGEDVGALDANDEAVVTGTPDMANGAVVAAPPVENTKSDPAAEPRVHVWSSEFTPTLTAISSLSISYWGGGTATYAYESRRP